MYGCIVTVGSCIKEYYIQRIQTWECVKLNVVITESTKEVHDIILLCT